MGVLGSVKSTPPTTPFCVAKPGCVQANVGARKCPHNAAMCLHVTYAARSFTSADVADLAQCAQQKKRPLTSTPCPMTLHLQCSQTGARAWIFEAIERMPCAGSYQLKTLVIVITTNFACCHIDLLHIALKHLLRDLAAVGGTIVEVLTGREATVSFAPP